MTTISESDNASSNIEALAEDEQSTGPHFTPNELIGYRIQPDENNWTAGRVRKYGAMSKNAGLEYFTPLAYCRTLEMAAAWIVDRDARTKSEMHDLTTAIQLAQKSATDAVFELERRLISGEVTLPNKARISDRVTLPVQE